MVWVREIPERGVHVVCSSPGKESPVPAPYGHAYALAAVRECRPEPSRPGVVEPDSPVPVVDEDRAEVRTGRGACTRSAGLEELAPVGAGLGVPYPRLALVVACHDAGAVGREVCNDGAGVIAEHRRHGCDGGGVEAHDRAQPRAAGEQPPVGKELGKGEFVMEGEAPRLLAGGEIKDADGAVGVAHGEALAVGAEGHDGQSEVEPADRLALLRPGGGVHEDDLGAPTDSNGGAVGTPSSGCAGDGGEQRPAAHVPDVTGALDRTADEEPPAAAARQHHDGEVRALPGKDAKQLDGLWPLGVGEVPGGDDPVVTGGVEARAVGQVESAVGRATTGIEGGTQAAAGGDVPDNHQPVVVAGGHMAAVAAKGGGDRAGVMTDESADL